ATWSPTRPRHFTKRSRAWRSIASTRPPTRGARERADLEAATTKRRTWEGANMRTTAAILIASLSGLTAVGLATPGVAQALNDKPIVVDGYRYGGQLPVGSDKNLDALRVLIKATDSMGQLRANHAGNVQWLLLGDTTAAWMIDGDGKWNGVDS